MTKVQGQRAKGKIPNDQRPTTSNQPPTTSRQFLPYNPPMPEESNTQLASHSSFCICHFFIFHSSFVFRHPSSVI